MFTVHVLVLAKFSQHKTQMNDTPKNLNALFPHLFYKVMLIGRGDEAMHWCNVYPYCCMVYISSTVACYGLSI